MSLLVLQRAARTASWLVVGGLSAIVLTRVLRPESRPVLIGAQGLAPWLLTPAPVLMLAAIRTGRRTLAVATLVLTTSQVLFVWQASGGRQADAAPPGSSALRVLSANVKLDNARIDVLGEQLARSTADVVLLQEITPAIAEQLKATAAFETYPYRLLDPREGVDGSAILSRLPISAGEVIYVHGYPMTRARLRTDAGPLDVIDVHAAAPLTAANTRLWAAQIRALAELATDNSVPLLMGGDFNSTSQMRPFDAIRTAGLRDAFDRAGRGFGASWSAPWSWPLMRLDHVLVTNSLAVRSARLMATPGSDHRQLMVEIALPRR